MEWQQPTQDQLKAGDQMTAAILNTLAEDGRVHAETAIAAAARLAGTFLFRSFSFPNTDAKPGMTVLSENANEEGPLLLQTLGACLTALEIEIPRKSMGDSIPPDNKPHLEITEMQKLLEPQLISIADTFNLDQVQAAHACALAAARLIGMTKEVLDVGVAFNIASMGFIEGAKTMPAELAGPE